VFFRYFLVHFDQTGAREWVGQIEEWSSLVELAKYRNAALVVAIVRTVALAVVVVTFR
jgi:hypothetical protein